MAQILSEGEVAEKAREPAALDSMNHTGREARQATGDFNFAKLQRTHFHGVKCRKDKAVPFCSAFSSLPVPILSAQGRVLQMSP